MNHSHQQYIQCISFLIIVSCLFSCNQKVDTSEDMSPQTFNPISAELPPPIKGKLLENLQPPTVIPLKKQPKITLAHANVHPAGSPTVVQIPNDVQVTTFGENGVPFPSTVPVKKMTVPASHPKPVPALAPAFKDDAVYNINYLSDEQGMQYGGVALLEDSRGNFWFGGTAGVVRYDGKYFFHYTKKEGFPERVNSLLEDGKGNIWMAGIGGLSSYDGHHITRYTIEEDEQSQEFYLSGCRNLMEDSKGNIWFRNIGNSTSGSGAYFFDGTNFTVIERKYWDQTYQDQDSLSLQFNVDYAVNGIFEDSRGQVWWTTQGSGVMRFDGQHIIHYTEKEGLIDNYIWCVMEDNNGNIWFGSSWGGLANKGISCYTPL